MKKNFFHFNFQPTIKKVRCIILFGFILLSYTGMGQPILGYDKIAWGATIENVRQLYTGIYEIVDTDADIGIRRFVQTNVGGGIESRTFLFFQNRLYAVNVKHPFTSNLSDAMAVASKLALIYGGYDDDDEMFDKLDGGITVETVKTNWRPATELTISCFISVFWRSQESYVGAQASVNYLNPLRRDEVYKKRVNKSAADVRL